MAKGHRQATARPTPARGRQQSPRRSVNTGSTRNRDDAALRRAGPPRKREARRGPPPLSRTACTVAGALVLAGVACGIVGWFVAYDRGGPTIVSSGTGQILVYALPAAAWLVGGSLLLRGGAGAVRAGLAAAGGAAVVSSGLSLAAFGHLVDAGFSGAGAGLYLVIAGNLVVDAGALVGLVSLGVAREAGAPERLRPGWLAASVIAAAVVGVAYGPGWERYSISSPTLGVYQRLTTTSRFANAWEVVVGEAVVVAGLTVIPILASQWRHRRSGAVITLSVLVGLAGLVAEDLYQVATTVAPSALGFGAGQGQSFHLKISVSGTAWLWVEIAGTVAAAALAVAQLVLAGAEEPPAVAP